MTNFSCQICNSQNVVKSMKNLKFFWKNVNKQLKSADFWSEMSKFQKILLNKVLAFLIQMSDHTLVFVVQLPNSQKPHTSIQVLLFTFIPSQKSLTRQFFDILSKICHFWILWKNFKNKLDGTSLELENTTKQVENQQIFLVTQTEKFSMPDYRYKLYKFTQYR